MIMKKLRMTYSPFGLYVLFTPLGVAFGNTPLECWAAFVSRFPAFDPLNNHP